MSDPAIPPVEPVPTELELSLARENAFLRAGVTPGEPLNDLIIRGYNGPLEVEDIKTYVTSVRSATGSGPGAPPPIDTVLTPEEQAQAAQRLALSNGATGAETPPPPDPIKEGMDLAREGLKRGMTEESAVGGYINHIVSAHMSGTKGLTVAERQGERAQRVTRV